MSWTPLLLLALLPLARGQDMARAAADRPSVSPTLDAGEARAARDRSLAYLVTSQNSDGSWGTRTIEGTQESFITPQGVYAWQIASNALCCLALLEADETPERRAVLERGLVRLCETEVPRRGEHWDVDHVWAGVYGTVACTRAAQDPRFAGAAWRKRLDVRGREFIGILEAMQAPSGGWGYYDDPTFSARPKWATSFTTAAVIPALGEGAQLGWIGDERVAARAVEYVRRCALPNGAYEYDLRPLPWIDGGETINDVKGSLGRIQVCNWARARAGDKSITADRVRDGLELFFRYHQFLDVARMRPIPHEAYYYNAGYFYFFGHYYAALAINLLPQVEREGWHRKLRPQVIKAQRADGTYSDFLASSYMVHASTAFAALALDAGIPQPASAP